MLPTYEKRTKCRRAPLVVRGARRGRSGGTDPPCSPRGKWSLEATKVGPGGLDRAGAVFQANKCSPEVMAELRGFAAGLVTGAPPQPPKHASRAVLNRRTG
ncbi:hypothetical protein GCM10010319_25360 [Streptomyces blastmyceticus]|uniref:Uncharacterized protein n=1 Tax=Streptomyces blastmyceticus TaxID=68180 RepID=A0ABN0WVK5_9ACTN